MQKSIRKQTSRKAFREHSMCSVCSLYTCESGYLGLQTARRDERQATDWVGGGRWKEHVWWILTKKLGIRLLSKPTPDVNYSGIFYPISWKITNVPLKGPLIETTGWKDPPVSEYLWLNSSSQIWNADSESDKARIIICGLTSILETLFMRLLVFQSDGQTGCDVGREKVGLLLLLSSRVDSS